MIVRRVAEVQEEEIAEEGAKGVKKRVLLGPEEGVPNFVMRYFTVSPGGVTPLHSHPWEHEIYILEGKGEVFCGGEREEVEEGAAVFIPPDVLHQIRNTGKSSLQLLCLIPLR